MGFFKKPYEVSQKAEDIPQGALDDVQYKEENYHRTLLNKTPDTRAIEMAVPIWDG